MVSGRPNIKFMFCRAEPAWPFIRLSIGIYPKKLTLKYKSEKLRFKKLNLLSFQSKMV